MASPNPTKEAGTQSDAVCMTRLGPANASVEFDRELLTKLKTAYNQALADENEIIVFQGHDIVTDYAKYLIEYLDGRLT